MLGGVTAQAGVAVVATLGQVLLAKEVEAVEEEVVGAVVAVSPTLRCKWLPLDHLLRSSNKRRTAACKQARDS